VFKACSKCHRVLCPNDFYKSHDHKSGLESQCKKCTDEKNETYFQTEKGKEVRQKIYIKANKTAKDNGYTKKYAQSDKFKDTQKAYRSSDQYRETLHKHQQTPGYKEKRRKIGRSDNHRLSNARYRQSDGYKERLKSDGYKEKAKGYRKKRILLYPGERLRVSMSRSVNYALSGNKRGRKWESLVGYCLQELMIHLEKQFLEGMSWDNYGLGKAKWTIDHIIPQSVFGYVDSNDLDFQRCWALENLRPMWAVDNTIKADKIIKPFQPSLDVVLYRGGFRNKVYGIIK
jgi:hypothetical protein